MSVMPRDHEWTVADLADTPDDGLRYELVDGVLLVSPAPTQPPPDRRRRAASRCCARPARPTPG